MQNNISKSKIVFFGSSSYVLPIIKVLKDNFNLALVVTTEKDSGAVPTYCKQNKIPFLSVSSLSDQTISHKLLAIKLYAAVLADFGLIIPDEILNAFPKGIINLHPSLLPKYRGPTPVQTAILNGEKITGISIMKVDSEIDHGPLLGSEEIEISDEDTSETLYKRAFELGANLLLELLPKYLEGNLKLLAQNHENATFTKPLTRQSGYIDFEKLKIKNSIKISDLKLKIRAFAPWPGVWTKVKLNGKEKIIKLLPNQMIQVEGKKPMNYKDLENGYHEGKEIISNIS